MKSNSNTIGIICRKKGHAPQDKGKKKGIQDQAKNAREGSRGEKFWHSSYTPWRRMPGKSLSKGRIVAVICGIGSQKEGRRRTRLVRKTLHQQS
ncbi:hypothetical protein U1Q18_014427 [Sarracenia purpurea var. burkii]